MVIFIDNLETSGHTKPHEIKEQSTDNINDILTLVKMKKHSLSSQKLTFIPFSYFVTNNHLTELNLSDNYLHDLPESIGQLQLLQDLNLSLNKFVETPAVICELTNLRKLNFSENMLRNLSPKLGNLEHLEFLDLSNNKLSNLPESCTKMQKIKDFDISNNLYDTIPKCVFENFANLESLDVSNNPEIRSFDPPVCSRSLEKFHSKGNLNLSFPSWIFAGNLKEMKVVELEECQFTMKNMIPTFSGEQMSLDKLILRNCLLSDKHLELILSRIKNISHLDVSNNNLLLSRQFQNFFLRFPLQAVVTPDVLLELNVSYTGISQIPAIISSLRNLKVLCLANNNISWLPDEICQLKQLETLIISSNPLVMLPDEIGSMKALRILEIAYCPLKTLPESFGELKQLVHLDLYSNEFDEIPAGLEKMENLQGLDLEQNYIQTKNIEENCLAGDGLAYATMRSVMRDSIGVYSSRLIGPLNDNTINDSDREFSSNTSSLSSMSVESLQTLVDDGKADESSEEDWDNSILFHDFDPSDLPPIYHPKKFVCPTKNVHYFRPADMLPPSILHQIVEERRNGFISEIPEIVEGQFDDAEEEES